MRWIKNENFDFANLKPVSDTKKVIDMRGNPLVLFANEWNIKMLADRNEGLILAEYSHKQGEYDI